MTVTPSVWLAEFLVNAGNAAGIQGNATITSLNNGPLGNGGFLVTWTDNTNNVDGAPGSDIIGQFFSISGARPGASFQINGFQAHTEREPVVAELTNGRIVVVYEDVDSVGSAIRFSIIDRRGTRLVSGTVEAPDNDTGQARNARVIALADGNFAVVYERVTTPDLFGTVSVFTRVEVFDGNGGFIGNDAGNSAGNSRDITQLSGGMTALVVAFNAAGQTRSRIETVYFTADGAAQSLVIGAETFTAGQGVTFNDVRTVALLPTPGNVDNFRHVIVWVSDSGQNRDVQFAILGNDGIVKGASFATSDTEDNNEPAVVALADGGFFIAWDDDTNGFIEGRRYDRNGNQVGSGVQIASGQVAEPALARLSDGRIVVSWTEFNGTDNDIRSMILDPRPAGFAVNGTAQNDFMTALVGGGVINGLGGSDEIFGSAVSDTIFGGSGFDTLYGGQGADVLEGGADEDFLYGGLSNDTMRGGAGADAMFGGTGRDMATYSDSPGAVFIDLSTGSGFFAHAAGDTLSSIEVVLGSNFNDTLFGDAGANTLLGGAGDDLLNGSAGDDSLSGGLGENTMTGGPGADRLDGLTGQDLASYEFSAAAVAINLQAGTASGGDAAGDVLIGIEHLAGSALADRLFGDAFANRLLGREGNDSLSGGDGNDTLLGDAGNDTLLGGGGNDDMAGGAGQDRMMGGTGNDIYRFNFAVAARLTLSETAGGGSDTLIITNALAEELGFRRSGSVLVIEQAGNLSRVVIEDHFSGIATNRIEQLTDAGGARFLKADQPGTATPDILVGASGSETLNGAAGNDIIAGGGAKDVLTGGLGADVFTYNAVSDSTAAAAGRDTILDFSQAQGDRMNLRMIDANTGLAGDQGFLFLGAGATAGAGTLAFAHVAGNTLIHADVDGGGADFAILLAGVHALTVSDFLL